MIFALSSFPVPTFQYLSMSRAFRVAVWNTSSQLRLKRLFSFRHLLARSVSAFVALCRPTSWLVITVSLMTQSHPLLSLAVLHLSPSITIYTRYVKVLICSNSESPIKTLYFIQLLHSLKYPFFARNINTELVQSSCQSPDSHKPTQIHAFRRLSLILLPLSSKIPTAIWPRRTRRQCPRWSLRSTTGNGCRNRKYLCLWNCKRKHWNSNGKSVVCDDRQVAESVGKWLQQRPRTGNSDMAAKTGNTLSLELWQLRSKF